MWNRLILCLGLLGALVPARAADNPLADVRTTLEKWVETRQMISRTRAAWQADKETLEQTIQLLQRELAAVEEQAGKLSTNNAAAQKEWTEAEALKKTSTGALDRAKEFATGFEAQLKALAPRLPVPLQEDKNFKGFMNRLPADPVTTKASAPERAQALVGLLNELDKFNTAVAVFSEKRKNPQGEEVAVETIYVGLGAAYFVNDSGDFAGSGTPGANGWEWTTQPELAPAVREVLHIYRNERAARFVPLPAAIR
jgi:hypothetical protein